MTGAGSFIRLVLVIGALVLASCGSEEGPVANATDETGNTVRPDSTQKETGPASSITASGIVTNEQGAPVAGAILDLIALEGQPNAAIESIRRTAEDGRFELAIAPGRWRLTIAADGYEFTKLALDVPSEGVLERDVMLRRP